MAPMSSHGSIYINSRDQLGWHDCQIKFRKENTQGQSKPCLDTLTLWFKMRVIECMKLTMTDMRHLMAKGYMTLVKVA